MLFYSVIPSYSPKESLRLIMTKWKLTCPNYHVLKLHLRNVLDAYGKLYILDNQPIEQPVGAASDSQYDAFQKYIDDESDVMSVIVLSISPRYSGSLRYKSSYKFVRDLESRFQGHIRTGRFLVLRDVLSLKMKEDQSVGDHLINMRRLFDCLASLEYPVTRHELVMFVFNSLTDSYQAKVAQSVGGFEMTIIGLHEMLISFGDDLHLKDLESLNFIDEDDWIDEIGDICCPVCGSKDMCEHPLDIRLLDIDSFNDTGIQEK